MKSRLSADGSTDASTKIVIWHSRVAQVVYWWLEKINLTLTHRSEFLVIIIAGSIPPLRPLMAVMWRRLKLLRHPLSSKDSRVPSTYGRKGDLTTLPTAHTQHGRVPLADAFGSRTNGPAMSGKNESEEDILLRQPEQPGIMKTTDINVNWNRHGSIGMGRSRSEEDKQDCYALNAV